MEGSILVTGASGLIGSAFVELLLESGVSVVAAGRNVEKLQKRFGKRNGLAFLAYDATKSNDLDIAVDYVVIAASPASPNLYVEKPVDVMLANTMGVNELLAYSVRKKVRKVVYVSSSEVYGKLTPPATGFREDQFGEIDLANPRNCYAESKRAAELLCVSYAKQYGLNVSIVRPGHVYGPTATAADMRVSSLWPRMAIRGEDIVMKSEGKQLRSYVHCHDCATAIMTVLLKGEPGMAYNVSNRRSVVTIHQLAEAICNEGKVRLRMELPAEKERAAFNPMMNSSLDATRLEALGWTAKYDFEAGVRETIERMRNRWRYEKH